MIKIGRITMFGDMSGDCYRHTVILPPEIEMMAGVLMDDGLRTFSDVVKVAIRDKYRKMPTNTREQIREHIAEKLEEARNVSGE